MALTLNGLFFYSGTPALGNLVLSIAPVAGVDEFGNVYRAHIVAGLNTGAQTQIVATGGFGQLIFPLNNATFPGLALINTSVRTGPPAYAQLSLFGPSASAAGLTNLISEAWNSANASGTSFANKTSGYFDSSATYKEFAFMDASGFAIRVCSELTASDPANVVTAANAGKPEIWHDMRPLSNSFVGTISGEYPPQFRKCADGDVQLIGKVKTPPTSGNYNSVPFATLPTAYRPNHQFQSSLAGVPDGAATPALSINTNGTLMFNFLPNPLAQTTIMFNCRYPLDNTGMIQS